MILFFFLQFITPRGDDNDEVSVTNLLQLCAVHNRVGIGQVLARATQDTHEGLGYGGDMAVS